MTARVATASLAIGLAGCGLVGIGDDRPPQLLGIDISEGRATCPSGPLPGPLLGPDAAGVLVLRRNSEYTIRTRVRTAGRSDRCIYKVAGASWDNPSREFNCVRETDPRMTIDHTTSTADLYLRNVTDHYVTISLAEYRIEDRSDVTPYRILHQFPVQFIP